MLKEDRYINGHKSQWEQLENYIKQIEKKGYSAFSAEELKEYLRLMKNVSHHLAYSRTHFTDSSLCQYLNELSVRAHNHLYVVKKSNLRSVIDYFKTGFAIRLKANRYYILAAFLLFMIGFAVSYLMVLNNPQSAGFFLPPDVLEIEDWDIKDSAWQEGQFFYLSSMVTVNNIGVSIKAFVFGITAGVLTSYVLLVNGGLLGALSSLVAQNTSNIFYFWALILPHGIIELSAIFISGGAGLRIGKALLMPGQYKRKDALIKNAKEAVMLMPGVIMLLIIAGLIEGFLTPAKISPYFKMGFAICTAVILVLYLLVPRKKR